MIKSSYLYYLSKLIKNGNKIGLNDNKKMFDIKKKIKYILDKSKKEFLDENKEEVINNENSKEICTFNIISIQYSIEKYCDALEAVYTYYFLINFIINGRCEECIQKIKGIKSKESDNEVKNGVLFLENNSRLKNKNFKKNFDKKIIKIILYRIFIFAILFIFMILFICIISSTFTL